MKIRCEACSGQTDIDAHVVLSVTLSGGMTCPSCSQKIPESEFVKQGLLTDETKEGVIDNWRGKMIIK